MSTGEDRRGYRVSLRGFVIVLSVVMTSLTLLVSVSLKVFTTLNQRHLAAVVQGADARRAADAARIHLLTLGRADALLLGAHDASHEHERTEAIDGMFSRLDDLGRLVDPLQKREVDEARRRVGAYLDAHDGEGRGAKDPASPRGPTASWDAALATLTGIADAAGARIGAEVESSNHWDHVVNALGWVVLALVVSGTVAGLYGLYRAALLPTIRLTEAIQRFGEGNPDSRAEPRGSLEIAGAARTFNEMADVITGQHARMLDFLGSVSKQLKQPVQIMRVTLAQRPESKLDERSQARMTALRRELDRLDGLVDGFLDASRLEWQRLDLQQPRRDIRPLVRDVVQVYESFSTLHQVSLAVPEEAVWVFFDAARMSQVLNMLLANAIQFSPSGGLVTVTVAVEAGGREATLAVTDHGLGIQPEVMERIFEPFHSAGSTRVVSHPRIGLVALSVAKRIVEAHGGRIDVESRVGEGTTFRLHLPLAHTRDERDASKEAAGVTAVGPEPAPSR